MNSRTKTLALVLVVVGILFAGLCLFVVEETQRAIVLRLGTIIVDPKTDQAEVLMPGLRVKLPLIDSVRYFDKRIQSLEISSSRIPTQEKKELIVDLFTKWRIIDFAKFYNTTGGNKVRAEQLLREKMVDGLRGEFGRRKLNDVVSHDRQSVMDKIRHDANNAAKTLGVEVVDARIVRIDLPDEVSEAVFNLMRTERQRVASEHRAQGHSRAEAIRADADAKVIVIGAQAERQANQVRGEGDAQAAKIYADIYGKDPEFYSFYRSLEAYRETFKRNNDMLVIKPDDAFFKYFRRNGAQSAQAENRKS
ncbi:MAG: HflC protein [Gammaproteobacteria bacterium 39-13]|nr:protease modulator HflC [Gammaproteobacteria bacterium]OJV88105.1 MAG: HflC protein [Gammaproteobacteria bacterium 39-13]